MYFCKCCLEHHSQDDMIIYKADEKSGFCRDCVKKLTWEQMNAIENKGFCAVKQLSFV
ncbi:MAG: hypothetical protein N4A64_11230 [Marinisporobacter sp.]|jgi:hypothetical protein|nr:hypothetical protein [Marinisporobacter sp.]